MSQASTKPCFVGYYTDILEGKIVACEKMKQAAKKILDDYENSDVWLYSEKHAYRHINL